MICTINIIYNLFTCASIVLNALTDVRQPRSRQRIGVL